MWKLTKTSQKDVERGREFFVFVFGWKPIILVYVEEANRDSVGRNIYTTHILDRIHLNAKCVKKRTFFPQNSIKN